MKLTLDALLTLDAIARRGSFSAAANELYRVPSALTYTVQKLEQDLGVALFDRSGHRAKLTPAGEELLQEGRIVLNNIARMEDRVKAIIADDACATRTLPDFDRGEGIDHQTLHRTALIALSDRFADIQPRRSWNCR